MINIDAVMIWLRYQMYKMEDVLTYIFGDDGRRYEGDRHDD